jgi:hypothetical protein
VTVTAGATSASFPVNANPVSSYTLVDIAAGYAGQNQFAEFSVRVS